MATPSTPQSTQTECGPYFCYNCNEYKHVMNEDFTCPSCHLGFIEENSPSTGELSIVEYYEEPDLRENLPMSPLTSNLINGGTNRTNRTAVRRGGTARRSLRRTRIATRSVTSNIRITLDMPGSGRRWTMMLGGRRSDITISDGQISGVEEAREAVARRRIRQLTRTSLELIQGNFGNLPMPGQEIRKIPIVYISNDHLEKELKCCVCLENFNLNDVALQLKCGHMYHQHCILPWLQRNSTCPNCRAILVESPCENGAYLMQFFRRQQRLLEQDLATPMEDMDTDSDYD